MLARDAIWGGNRFEGGQGYSPLWGRTDGRGSVGGETNHMQGADPTQVSTGTRDTWGPYSSLQQWGVANQEREKMRQTLDLSREFQHKNGRTLI